ncbi:MAG: DUF3822 family protein [Muribaculaceae bacterium]|nr:DUF3822 family protein [Muribaculaceae bacterium]
MNKEENISLDSIGVHNPEKWRLVIKIGAKNLSYALYCEETSEFVGNTALLQSNDELLSCKQIEDAIYSTPLPGNDFKSVGVIVEPNHFLIVPLDVAKLCDNKKMIETAFGKFDNEKTVICEQIQSVDIGIVWSVDESVYNFMLRTFYNATFTHSMTQIITQSMRRSMLANTPRMFIVADSELLKVVVSDSNKLCAANMYECTSMENAGYYLMALWKECNLDQLSAEVLISGCWEKRAEIEQTLREYIKIVLPDLYPPSLLKISKDAQSYNIDMMLKLVNTIYANN